MENEFEEILTAGKSLKRISADAEIIIDDENETKISGETVGIAEEKHEPLYPNQSLEEIEVVSVPDFQINDGDKEPKGLGEIIRITAAENEPPNPDQALEEIGVVSIPVLRISDIDKDTEVLGEIIEITAGEDELPNTNKSLDEIEVQINKTDKGKDAKTVVAAEIDEKIENFKEIEAAINLEKILEEQETHDLYCPNCHSCITRRVILKKRKRITKEDGFSAKLAKGDSARPDINSSGSRSANEDEGSHAAPEVFRCLSCFSYFISTDGGFKLFKIFGKKEESSNTQAPDESPERSQNRRRSFYEIFTGRKKQGEIGLESGDDASKTTLLSLPRETESLPDKMEVASSSGIPAIVEEVVKDSPIQNESPSEEVKTPASIEELKGKMVELDQESETMPVPEQVAEDAEISSSSAGPSTVNSYPFVRGLNLPVVGNETWISIGDQEIDEAVKRAPKWNLLKAIVYGGLLESIASFSIVSAAAGAGNHTAGVFAVGLGALAGALPTLIHNMIELRNKASKECYERELGDKSNFWLNFIVALLFFIVVGAAPPFTYLLSFRTIDDREMKMAAVASASFAVIILLAVAKAHVQERRQKISYVVSIVQYVVLAAGASGLSFFVGAGIQRLIDAAHFSELFLSTDAELATPMLHVLRQPGLSTVQPMRAQ